MRIAVCDNDPIYVQKLCNKIIAFFNSEKIKLDLIQFYKGSELFVAHKNHRFDLIMMDISMIGDMAGYQVSEAIRIFDNNVSIIYISNNRNLVYQSFKFSPFYYILKNQVDSVLIKSLKLFLEKHYRYNNVFSFKTTLGRTKKIGFSKIDYIETNGDCLKVHLNNSSFDIRSSLAKLEGDFERHGFMRVHKSFIVNLLSIDSIENRMLILTSGDTVPYSRNKAMIIKDEFQRCLKRI
ncbi:MAG: response regulator transcription factor [Clostridiales bacterium]|nr:response regulator transcription factor [Clostridiales bacterium]